MVGGGFLAQFHMFIGPLAFQNGALVLCQVKDLLSTSNLSETFLDRCGERLTGEELCPATMPFSRS